MPTETLTNTEEQDVIRKKLSESGIKVTHAVTINQPPTELYTFWREFTNLPHIMDHLESVTVSDNTHSHLVAKAPLDRMVEWDAEIINEEPGKVIAWRSLPGADVDSAGSVLFKAAPVGRGTEVRVELSYLPSAGKVGAAVARLLGEEPKKQLDDDLRHFKQLMERSGAKDVSEIGGKVAFPNLLPDATAKFAATGLSEGLRAELRRDGILVTTIVPGLLRTGSYFNALFKGQKAAEFAWFSFGDTLPDVSISAERAAREIVRATRRGEAERILSVPAKLLSLMQGIAPKTTAALLTLIDNALLPLPSDEPNGGTATPGKEAAPDVSAHPLFEAATILGQAAAARLNE